MIQLVFFLGLGVGLLLLLYLLARRSDARAEGGAQALVEARHAVASLRTGLLPVEMVERIFARGDLDFIMSNSGKHVQELFRQERKKIALSWVAQLRRQILNLKDFHLGQSRLYARLDPRAELALALHFASLMALCRVLQVAFYLRGPYAARHVIGPAISAAGRVCTISERSLAFLTPDQRGAFRSSAGRPAAV
jgi:hypothetical protein